ncbi:MAG: hypothetical protein KAV87_10660, partial [Desulfobacteraceae bacterium]|nr:hypothetical protein [Desulfobacteraceae bacterium]
MDGSENKQMIANPKAHENWKAYERSRDAGHLNYIDLAKKCERFYRGGGEQWDDTDKAALEAEGRPALEINMILSTINTMIGEQTSTRSDIVYKPRKDATEETADVLTQLALQIQDNNGYEWVESQVFADGLIQDRGYFDIRLDFTDHIEGEIRITAEDPLSILPDPTAKDYDPKTWKEVIKTKWMTLDDVELQYGKEKAKQLENFISSVDSAYGVDSVRFEESTFGDSSGWYNIVESENHLKKARVVERQHRKLSMVKFFVDSETGDMRAIPDDWDDERIEKVKKQANVFVMQKVVSRIRWTASIDGFLLHDDWSPYQSFTIVPFFPYFRRGKPFGVVRNLISPQEQLNKLESQELHIINTTANSGWLVEAGSLTNMDEDELEQRGAETGLVMVYGRNRNAPEKIMPNSVPTGIDRAAQKASSSIRSISGVGEGLLDISGPEVSGVALKQKRSSGMMQLQVPFDNLSRSRRILAERILELIQRFYTETRVFQVINFKDPQQTSQEVVINGINAVGEVINDVTLGEYDTIVSSTPARDSYMDSQFAEALSLRDVGVDIPDDVVIEVSNIQNKKEIADRVRQMQGMAEPTEQELQLAQFQQEIMMQQMQLGVAELEGKVIKLQSEAALAEAKAQETGDRMEFDTSRFGTEIQV